jgi:hypothetical protein
MKNAPRKRMTVVLLDADGKQEPGEYAVIQQGAAGIRVAGLARTLWLSDKGKTWKPAGEK